MLQYVRRSSATALDLPYRSTHGRRQELSTHAESLRHLALLIYACMDAVCSIQRLCVREMCMYMIWSIPREPTSLHVTSKTDNEIDKVALGVMGYFVLKLQMSSLPSVEFPTPYVNYS